MLSDASVHWFWAQALAALAAYLVGAAIGRGSRSWGEIALGAVAALTIGWALRRFSQDALLEILPLDLLVYTEGTLIVPFFMLLAGIISARAESRGGRLAGPLLAAFGATYLLANGAWMLAPRVELRQNHPILLSEAVVAQSRPDTCVGAALATVLRNLDRFDYSRETGELRLRPGRDACIDTNEGEMSRLADVREGYGSTLLRALNAARARLAGTSIEARLHTCSAESAVALATPSRPALVTLRSSLQFTHMVAVLGRSVGGQVLVANPAIDTEFGRKTSRLPDGVALVEFSEFADRYTGAAIFFTDRCFTRVRMASLR